MPAIFGPPMMKSIGTNTSSPAAARSARTRETRAGVAGSRLVLALMSRRHAGVIVEIT
jgi:hypothetical protein